MEFLMWYVFIFFLCQIVGLSAKQGRMRNPVNTVMQVKHIVGRKFEDQVIQDLKRQSPFKVVESKGLAGFEIEANNKKNIVSSLEVAGLVFRKLKGLKLSFFYVPYQVL